MSDPDLIRRFRTWQINWYNRRGFAVIGFRPVGGLKAPSRFDQYPPKVPIVSRHANLNESNPYLSKDILGWARRHKFNRTFVAYRVSPAYCPGKPTVQWPSDTCLSGDWRPVDGSLTLRAFCPITQTGFKVKR